MSKLTKNLLVRLPDTRAVEIDRYGGGNLKIGLGVVTYSRVAGHPDGLVTGSGAGTCPGATPLCELICYAKRIGGPVREVYLRNGGSDVPPIPDDAKILRIHVSGDFDSVDYILNWMRRLEERPDVIAWAYTRSWRVPELLPFLERLRALPNMQLFASMDESADGLPPAGWRRAWIDGDPRAGEPTSADAHTLAAEGAPRNLRTFDGTLSLVCPEETKHQPNCERCGYCFKGQRNDVTFLRH